MIPYASYDGHPMTQEEVADWMGFDSPAPMNAEHDALHLDLSRWLGVPSYSMIDAAGHPLTPEERRLADYEEHAVCAVQRFLQHHRKAA